MITLDMAVDLLKLPRDVGVFPETGDMIQAGIGPFGPFLKYGTSYVSLKDDDVLEVGINRAIDLVIEHKKKREGISLGKHPDSGNDVLVRHGRYGKYLQHGDATFPLGRKAIYNNIELAQAVDLLANAPISFPKKPAAKKPVAKKPATKKPVAKKATAKKPAKKTTAKKTVCGENCETIVSKPSSILNRETLLDYLSQHYPHPSKRQIADEFKIKGDERIELKKLLGILKSEGLYQPKASEKLSAVLWLEILPPDADGQLLARPAKPKQHGSHLPIYVDTSQHAPEIGSKILARLRFHTDHYRAIILKMMTRPAPQEDANSHLGIIEKYQGKFYFVAIERGVRLDFLLPETIPKNYQLRDGHLVKIYLKSDMARGYQDSYRAPNIDSVTIIAHKRDPHALSLLALAKHDITLEFPAHVRQESESLKPILAGEARFPPQRFNPFAFCNHRWRDRERF